MTWLNWKNELCWTEHRRTALAVKRKKKKNYFLHFSSIIQFTFLPIIRILSQMKEQLLDLLMLKFSFFSFFSFSLFFSFHLLLSFSVFIIIFLSFLFFFVHSFIAIYLFLFKINHKDSVNDIFELYDKQNVASCENLYCWKEFNTESFTFHCQKIFPSWKHCIEICVWFLFIISFFSFCFNLFFNFVFNFI